MKGAEQMNDDKKVTIEITVDENINFSIINPCGDKNNPALHIALAMVKLITEAGRKNE